MEYVANNNLKLDIITKSPISTLPANALYENIKCDINQGISTFLLESKICVKLFTYSFTNLVV
jgi:hypothetical protein